MTKGSKRPRRALDEPPLPVTLAAITAAVLRDGAILTSTLPGLGVPRARLPEAKTALAAAGLEVGGKFVRMPLATQLAKQLDVTPMVPLRAIDSHVAGATKREATATARALVKEGRARLLLRSTELFVAACSAPGLDERALARLEDVAAALTATLKRARKSGATLLHADVEEALRKALPSVTASAPSARAASPTVKDVNAAIDARREPSGLTWVPDLVRALGGATPPAGDAVREAVHAELLRGARSGDLELRPESGMGRLSPEDDALCISGPQGSRLSWVRRIRESS